MWKKRVVTAQFPKIQQHNYITWNKTQCQYWTGLQCTCHTLVNNKKKSFIIPHQIFPLYICTSVTTTYQKSVHRITHQRHLKFLLLVQDHFTVLEKKYGADTNLLSIIFFSIIFPDPNKTLRNLENMHTYKKWIKRA
jgi:hypothetical protein